MTLLLNISLCVDLLLTLTNPFYPSKRRMKFYLLFSIGGSAFVNSFIFDGITSNYYSFINNLYSVMLKRVLRYSLTISK
jgi:hypothetical protein